MILSYDDIFKRQIPLFLTCFVRWSSQTPNKPISSMRLCRVHFVLLSKRTRVDIFTILLYTSKLFLFCSAPMHLFIRFDNIITNFMFHIVAQAQYYLFRFDLGNHRLNSYTWSNPSYYFTFTILFFMSADKNKFYSFQCPSTIET